MYEIKLLRQGFYCDWKETTLPVRDKGDDIEDFVMMKYFWIFSFGLSLIKPSIDYKIRFSYCVLSFLRIFFCSQVELIRIKTNALMQEVVWSVSEVTWSRKSISLTPNYLSSRGFKNSFCFCTFPSILFVEKELILRLSLPLLR